MNKYYYFISVLMISIITVSPACKADIWVAPGSIFVREITNVSKSENGELISICLVVSNPETKENILATLDVPIAKKSRWAIDRAKSKRIKGVLRRARTKISFYPDLSNLRAGCDKRKTILDLMFMDIDKYRERVRQKDSDNIFELKNSANEAVFVTVLYSKDPMSAYYVSDKPLFENVYVLNILLKARFRYTGSLCQKQTLIKDTLARNDLHARDQENRTQLHCAAINNDVKKIQSLLTNGLDKDAETNNGATPLFFAVARGNVDVVKILIKNEASVNIVSEKGGTPLMAAARFGHLEMVKILLEYGADPDLTDLNDMTAYAWAKRKNRSEIMNILKK